MDEEYFSIRQASHSLIKREGSKFIADAFPVESEEEAKKHLAEIKKKYFDATHHCYAVAIGASRSFVRSSDDGEPSGTAGIKILSAVESKNLSDILVVVTRYYGGTKLGVGGLGRAYFESALEALSQVEKITKAELQIVKISFPFDVTNSVMNLIHSSKLRIDATFYDVEKTVLFVLIPPAEVNLLEQKFIDVTRGKISAEIAEKKTVVLH